MFRTKRQQKKICSQCPLAKAANIVGDSVVLVIVRDLISGPKRYTDLLDSLAGVSSRTLTLKLKLLIDQHIVRHDDTEAVYVLTEKGVAIKASIDALAHYGERYL